METNYFAVLKDKKGIHWLPSTKDKKPALLSYKEYFENPPTDQKYQEWIDGIQTSCLTTTKKSFSLF